MKGFLGTRADFFSDLLILALAIILPALILAIISAVNRRLVFHKRMMVSIFSALVLYVVLYEGNLAFLGGMSYLRANIRVSEGPYFAFVAFHIALSAVALVLGGVTMRKGEAAISSGQVFTSYHRKIAWAEVILLAVSVITGLVIYYLTFVY